MVTVFINGCFDVLHRGHFEMFKYAKTLGDFLIVGIDSDEKIKKSKGITRPHNCLEDRMFALECIKYIDKVESFNSAKELCCMVESYSPDLMIVGSDWRGKQVIGSQYAGKLIFFDRIGNYSTTKILGETT